MEIQYNGTGGGLMKNQTPLVTVQELVEKLSGYPQDMPVKIRALRYEDSWADHPTTTVDDIDLAYIETVPNAQSGTVVVIDAC